MKLLLIGDCNHQLLVSWVRGLKGYASINPDAFSISKLSKSNAGWYNNVYYARTFGEIYKLPIMRKFIYFFEIIFKFRKTDKDYDIIHIHFARLQYLLIWPFIKHRSKKTIVTVWGTEFYRSSCIKRLFLGILFKSANLIHCTNDELNKSLTSYYNFDPDKVVVIPFFVEILKTIDNISLSKEDCKGSLTWDLHKKQIVIGYNYNQGQQHIAIVKQLAQLDNEKVINEVEFIFPLTYGSDIAYRDTVVQSINGLSFSNKVYTSFLPTADVARMRVGADVFVNLQVSDQFSGALVESLYSGNIVITGSWLPYKTLKDLGVFFIEIDKVDDLNKTIYYVLSNYNELSMRAENNKPILRGFLKEEEIAKKWMYSYSSLLN